jgi:hypothetical protein
MRARAVSAVMLKTGSHKEFASDDVRGSNGVSKKVSRERKVCS